MLQTTKRPASNEPLFNLGQLVMTAGIYELVSEGLFSPAPFLARHQAGDWGEICREDWIRNNRSLNQDPEQRGRLFSVFSTPDGTKIWIITEWDRSVTTILLPDEY